MPKYPGQSWQNELQRADLAAAQQRREAEREAEEEAARKAARRRPAPPVQQAPPTPAPAPVPEPAQPTRRAWRYENANSFYMVPTDPEESTP